MEDVLPIHHRSHRAAAPVWHSMKRLLGIAAMGLFFLATVLSLASVIQPRGARLIAVQSDSMGSTLPFGSAAIITPASTYRAGEIIAFRLAGSPTLVTHRVVGVSTNGTSPSTYQTKGDARATIDAARVTESAILGRITFGIPVIGYLLAAVQTTVGLVTLVIVPMTLIVSHQLRQSRRRWREGQYQSVLRVGPPLVTSYDA